MPPAAFLPSHPLRLAAPRLTTATSAKPCFPYAPRTPPRLSSAPPPLPPRAKELIEQQQAYPLFDASKPPPAITVALTRAQSAGAFITLSDLPDATAPSAAADAIRQHAALAIDAARAAVLEEYPGIDAPGGALYPEHRALACWRDLSEFARVVAYGVASGREVFSERGVEVMKQVYEVLEVPMDAMLVAVHVLAYEIGDRVGDEPELRVEIGKGFAALFEVLERF